MTAHIVKSYDGALTQLKTDLLTMLQKVLAQMDQATLAFEKQDESLAKKVIREDHAVNSMEVLIDDEIATIFAKRQPIAVDLRYLLGLLRMSGDLERMGDEVRSIAKMTKAICQERTMPSESLMREVLALFEIVRRHVTATLIAFDNNGELDLRALIDEDSEIDHCYADVQKTLYTFMNEKIEHANIGLEVAMVIRALERVGDHSTNLLEAMVYIKEGVDIRHC